MNYCQSTQPQRQMSHVLFKTFHVTIPHNVNCFAQPRKSNPRAKKNQKKWEYLQMFVKLYFLKRQEMPDIIKRLGIFFSLIKLNQLIQDESMVNTANIQSTKEKC